MVGSHPHAPAGLWSWTSGAASADTDDVTGLSGLTKLHDLEVGVPFLRGLVCLLLLIL